MASRTLGRRVLALLATLGLVASLATVVVVPTALAFTLTPPYVYGSVTYTPTGETTTITIHSSTYPFGRWSDAGPGFSYSGTVSTVNVDSAGTAAVACGKLNGWFGLIVFVQYVTAPNISRSFLYLAPRACPAPQVGYGLVDSTGSWTIVH